MSMNESVQSRFEYFVKWILRVYSSFWSSVTVIVSIVGYSKRCVLFNGKYIEYYVRSNENIYLLEKVCAL